MDGYIDIRDVGKCPKCGGQNTTTGQLCVYCSIERRYVVSGVEPKVVSNVEPKKEDFDFRRWAVAVLSQVKEMIQI